MEKGLYDEILKQEGEIERYNRLLEQMDENNPFYGDALEIGKTICSTTLEMVRNYQSFALAKISQAREDGLTRVISSAERLKKTIDGKLAIS